MCFSTSLPQGDRLQRLLRRPVRCEQDQAGGGVPELGGHRGPGRRLRDHQRQLREAQDRHVERVPGDRQARRESQG